MKKPFDKRLKEARKNNITIMPMSTPGTRRKPVCVECGEKIHGDVMKPEGNGPMHTDCWTNWVKEQ